MQSSFLAPGATLARQDIGCVHRIACHGTVRFVGIFLSQCVGFSFERFVAGAAGLYPLTNFECIHGFLDF